MQHQIKRPPTAGANRGPFPAIPSFRPSMRVSYFFFLPLCLGPFPFLFSLPQQLPFRESDDTNRRQRGYEPKRNPRRTEDDAPRDTILRRRRRGDAKKKTDEKKTGVIEACPPPTTHHTVNRRPCLLFGHSCASTSHYPAAVVQ